MENYRWEWGQWGIGNGGMVICYEWEVYTIQCMKVGSDNMITRIALATVNSTSNKSKKKPQITI